MDKIKEFLELRSKIAKKLTEEHDKELFKFAIRWMESYPYIIEVPETSYFLNGKNATNSNLLNIRTKLIPCKTLKEASLLKCSANAIIYDLSKIDKKELIKLYEEKYG